MVRIFASIVDYFESVNELYQTLDKKYHRFMNNE